MSRCGNVDRSFDLSYLISTEKKTHITRFAGDMRFLFSIKSARFLDCLLKSVFLQRILRCVCEKRKFTCVNKSREE